MYQKSSQAGRSILHPRCGGGVFFTLWLKNESRINRYPSMLTKPFNKELLWKSSIEKANYPKPVRKPPMDLDQVCSLTGYRTKEMMNIYKKIDWSYKLYSKNYWEGVEIRKAVYRLKNSIRLQLDEQKEATH
jgi:hypothetical protein